MFRFVDRVAVENVVLRKLLRKADVTNLADILTVADSSAPWLSNVISFLISLGELPACWRTLLRDLGSETSVVGMFDFSQPASLDRLIQVAQNGVQNSEDLHVLEYVAPTFYAVYRLGDAQSILCSMWKHLIEKIGNVMKHEIHHLDTIDPALITKQPLPAIPIKTMRGSYKKDMQKVSVCSKKAPSHRTLAPGIFTVNCPHGELQFHTS